MSLESAKPPSPSKGIVPSNESTSDSKSQTETKTETDTQKTEKRKVNQTDLESDKDTTPAWNPSVASFLSASTEYLWSCNGRDYVVKFHTRGALGGVSLPMSYMPFGGREPSPMSEDEDNEEDDDRREDREPKEDLNNSLFGAIWNQEKETVVDTEMDIHITTSSSSSPSPSIPSLKSRCVAMWLQSEDDGHVDFFGRRSYPHLGDLQNVTERLTTEWCTGLRDVFDDGSGIDRGVIPVDDKYFTHNIDDWATQTKTQRVAESLSPAKKQKKNEDEDEADSPSESDL